MCGKRGESVQAVIRFRFNINKAVGAMAHLISALGPIDKAKLMKLLYIADRNAFLRLGKPITGDRQFAMPYGPVPSMCLDLINANVESADVFRYIHVSDGQVRLQDNAPVPPALDADEISVIDDVISTYGSIPTWPLVRQTHSFPEYQEAYVEDTSTQIPYETILKHHGNEDQYRHNRPVVSAKMAAHIDCPFPRTAADADL